MFDAIADTPEESANLRTRSELMRAITVVIKRHGWTQVEAAKRAGITQPRLNELVNGRVSKFSIDALVQVAATLGMRVRIEVEEFDSA